MSSFRITNSTVGSLGGGATANVNIVANSTGAVVTTLITTPTVVP